MNSYFLRGLIFKGWFCMTQFVGRVWATANVLHQLPNEPKRQGEACTVTVFFRHNA